ncbi:hypothetical protein FRC17_004186, partial [Serendipita sp. 399]
MHSEDLATALAKIRPHTNSKLPHQRKPAQLLVALESTLDQNASSSELSRPTSTAYFAALITTLEECILRNELSLEEGSTLAAILYLLATVGPFVPHTVLRTNLPKLYQLLPPLLPLALQDHAPPLRSLISLFGTITTAMDQSMVQSTLSTNSGSAPSSTSVAIRQTFSSLLELTLDPRPKVRKRAAEVVKEILGSPPSPFIIHPWSHLVANWSCAVIAQIAGIPVTGGKKGTGGGEEEGIDRMIHLLAFLRTVPHIFSASVEERPLTNGENQGTNLETMTRYLLAAPKLSNPYLTQASYQLLSALFTTEREEGEDDEEDENDAARRRAKAQNVLDTLIRSQPSKSDTQISPYWLSVVARATIAAHSSGHSIPRSSDALTRVWSMVWGYLDSTCPTTTVKAAADSLRVIAQSNCFSVSKGYGLEDDEGSSLIQSVVQLAEKSVGSLAYAGSIPEILGVLEVLVTSMSAQITRYREWAPTTMTLAKLHKTTKSSSPFLPLLHMAVNLRNSKDFQHKEQVNSLITALMRMIGVDGVLERIPLGILPQERSKSSTQANAYLLPLIPPSHFTPLSHFVNYFIPLSESLWNLAQDSEKEVEQKVYRVLMEQ